MKIKREHEEKLCLSIYHGFFTFLQVDSFFTKKWYMSVTHECDEVKTPF